MRPLLIISLLTLFPFGATAGNTPYGESGHFWCGERFLKEGVNHFGYKEENAAKRGYIYVLAAALALQKKNVEEEGHWFYKPDRMQIIDAPEPTKSGFQVITFLVKPLTSNGEDEIVVAFTGSDQVVDWVKTNVQRRQTQFDEARRYIIHISTFPQVRGKKIIVSGISLGGGLAVYVTKNELTSNYIKQAWAINSSPVTYASDKIDKRIWNIFSDGEILSSIRNLKTLLLFKGVNKIGAPDDQTAKDFVLVKSNSIYAHFRWVITREVLFVADYALTNRGTLRNKDTEPLQILRRSSFASCKDSAIQSTTSDILH